jgi:hypothetical protein
MQISCQLIASNASRLSVWFTQTCVARFWDLVTSPFAFVLSRFVLFLACFLEIRWSHRIFPKMGRLAFHRILYAMVFFFVTRFCSHRRECLVIWNLYRCGIFDCKISTRYCIVTFLSILNLKLKRNHWRSVPMLVKWFILLWYAWTSLCSVLPHLVESPVAISPQIVDRWIAL